MGERVVRFGDCKKWWDSVTGKGNVQNVLARLNAQRVFTKKCTVACTGTTAVCSGELAEYTVHDPMVSRAQQKVGPYVL
jgi:hypothetical protein